MIEAVLIDLGGVLLLPAPDTIRSVLRAYDLDCDDTAIERAAYSGGPADLGFHPDDVEGRVDVFLRHYAGCLGVPPEMGGRILPDLRHALLENWWVPRKPDETYAALRALAELDVTVGFVSNAEGEAGDVLRLHGIAGSPESVFPAAQVVDSFVVGYAKPDPRIFEVALEAVGAPAEATVHVGDSILNDVDCARAAGIEPLHFNPYRLCTRDDHGHVASVWDVVELVRERAGV